MADPLSLGIAAVGSLASGFMGIQAANHAQYSQYKYNKLLQEQQAALNYGYYKKQLKFGNTHMYDYQRRGLEAAGYNPMLAVQGVNADTAGTSFASGNSVGMPDAVGALNSGIDRIRMLQDVKASEANIENVNADTVKKNAEIENVDSDTILKQAQEDFTRSETVLNEKNASWYDTREALEVKRKSEEILKMESEINYMKEQVKLQKTANDINQYNATTNRIGTNANVQDIQENRATMTQQQREYNKWAKKYPWLKSIDQTLTRYLGGGTAAAGGYVAGKHAPVNSGFKKPLGFR